MQKKAEAKKWPAAAKEMFNKGIEKLERMHPTHLITLSFIIILT